MNQNENANIIARICNDILLFDIQSSVPVLSGKEWDEVLEMASAQGVLPIIIQKLNQVVSVGSPMEKQQLLQWIGVTLQNEQNYKMRLYVMRELARMFAPEGIDIMFLKGAAIAQLYPVPGWRAFSDIDYYLYGESEKGIEVMRKHGIENSAYYHHHTQASLNGILLENHYDFVERVNHKCDIVLDDALKEMAEKEGHSLKAEFLGDDVKNDLGFV